MQPLGRRTFTAGEVLTAANVNGYLMAQVIGVFSAASARDAAITSPFNGQFAFLLADDKLTAYRSGSWSDFTPSGGGDGLFSFMLMGA